MNNSTFNNQIGRLKICDRNHKECCEKSATPDEAVFRNLATAYSQNHPAMRTGDNCNETFPGGIVNGAFWYELNGRFLETKINIHSSIY